jgi:hypothetical protein
MCAAPILRLVKYSNHETQAILRAVLARAVRGEVIGITLCLREAGGAEQCVFTGPYKANPAEAVNAAVRIKVQLAQMQCDLI